MNCQIFVAQMVTCVALGCQSAPSRPAADAVLRSPETERAITYRFSAADEALLDEVQRGCFLYFWKEVGTPAKLVKDRLQGPVASIAAVGFQLSALPIGVERKWITRAEGEERARTVLKALLERDDNKKFGMYLHFPDLDTGGMSHHGYEPEASTVDTALLIAGALPAGQYFGGEVQALVDRLVREANWKKYATGPNGVLSMAWKPKARDSLAGEGEFITWYWHTASDEERLVYFLAVAAPNPDFAVAPQMYYRLERPLKSWKAQPPFAASWPGCLFTYFFAHCWIDYRALGADDPARFGVTGPRIDWFENSRRAVLTHRSRCLEEAGRYKTFAPDRWGLAPCVGRDGYIVPEVRPNLSDKDDWCDGTVAPYAAGTAILFTPAESIAALRAFRELKGKDGKPLVWRDPQDGGYGFADAFNLDQGYVSDDYVGIDQGPLLLGIENARTGLIWKLFMASATAKRGVERLGLK